MCEESGSEGMKVAGIWTHRGRGGQVVCEASGPGAVRLGP